RPRAPDRRPASIGLDAAHRLRARSRLRRHRARHVADRTRSDERRAAPCGASLLPCACQQHCGRPFDSGESLMSAIRIALAGAGAFGIKHLEALQKIDGVEVVSLIGRELEKTRGVADKFGIAHVTTNLEESLARKDV